MFPILAHGVLGPYDELIFLGIVVIFAVMMAVSWFQSRMAADDPDATASAPDPTPSPNHADHFTLD